MRKIKITEEQANILKHLKEDEIESIRTGSKFSTQSSKIKQNFKKETKGTGIKINEGPIPEIAELAIMVLDAIRTFYQDPSTTGIDPKWVAMGFNAGEVRELITSVGLMGVATAKGIGFFGKIDILPKLKEIFNAIRGKAEEKEKERGVNTYKESGGVHIEEDGNLPMGVSSNDPHFNPPEKTRPSSSKFSLFNVLWMDKEIAILESRNRLYAIIYIDIEGVEDYAEREVIPYKKGDTEREYYDDFEIDEEALEGFVNDNYDTIGIGAGYEDWEHDSSRITKMDDEMKADILGTWNDPELQQIFNNMDENTAADSGSYVPGIDGNYNTNVDKDMLPSRQIDVDIDEVTSTAPIAGGSSVGQHDVNALGNSAFMNAGNKLNKKCKGGNVIRKEQLEENAKTDTQWPKGSFVEMPACSKLDNNKEAQNGGCNQGAGANIKYKSSKNSVISNEALYNEVAEKTGRPVNEVKTLIDGYNNK